MITLSQLTEWLGWASIVNIVFLMLTTISLIFMRDMVSSLHSKWFDIPKEDLPPIYFNYLANYKIMSLIFCIVPYISLKLMGY